jgi:hypothetical protein
VKRVHRNRLRKREPIAVRGKLVDIACVGSMVILQTTVQTYVTHTQWLSQMVDDFAIERIRAIYALGDYTTYELARMFDVSSATVLRIVRGRDRFEGLAPVRGRQGAGQRAA